MTHQQKAVYNSGHKCRDDLGSMNKCPYGNDQFMLKHYWMAGWIDADMESK